MRTHEALNRLEARQASLHVCLDDAVGFPAGHGLTPTRREVPEELLFLHMWGTQGNVFYVARSGRAGMSALAPAREGQGQEGHSK